jgi:spore coat polysaccharide biosynthesis predicted glycosyltransferase SpsG
VIRVNGGKNIGFGHLYRTLAIAQNIHSHDITFVTSSEVDFSPGRDFLSKYNYPMAQIDSDDHFIEQLSELKPDIVINDILDTDADYIDELKKRGIFVVNFEDLGEGNRSANVVINDLYPDIFPQENHWYGVEHSILNPNFEMVAPRKEPTGKVDHILLAYGGSDPSNLTEKALNAIQLTEFDGDVTIVVGPGFDSLSQIEALASEMGDNIKILKSVDNMALLMKKASLALTSAGRTVTELMTVGVPTIAMCQNLREMRHNHASSNFGVVNLGLGQSITPEVLAKHIEMYMNDENLRCDMYNRMTRAVKGRSNYTVVSKILSRYTEFKESK